MPISPPGGDRSRACDRDHPGEACRCQRDTRVIPEVPDAPAAGDRALRDRAVRCPARCRPPRGRARRRAPRHLRQPESPRGLPAPDLVPRPRVRASGPRPRACRMARRVRVHRWRGAPVPVARRHRRVLIQPRGPTAWPYPRTSRIAEAAGGPRGATSCPSGPRAALPRGPRPTAMWRGERAGRGPRLNRYQCARRPNCPSPHLMR